MTPNDDSRDVADGDALEGSDILDDRGGALVGAVAILLLGILLAAVGIGL
jgi:hypothetical protein